MTDKIKVYYDGACPSCQRDRRRYEQMAGDDAVEWCDISRKPEAAAAQGIDPDEALVKLHIQTPDGKIISDVESYFLLLKPIRWLRPLLWVLQRPMIREWLRRRYRQWVLRRLSEDGRLPDRYQPSTSKTDKIGHSDRS